MNNRSFREERKEKKVHVNISEGKKKANVRKKDREKREESDSLIYLTFIVCFNRIERRKKEIM